MNSGIICFLLVVFVQSGSSDLRETSRFNDLGNVVAGKEGFPGKISAGGEKDKTGYGATEDNDNIAGNMKSISSKPRESIDKHALNEKPILVTKQTEGKFTKTNKLKYDKNGMKKNFKDLKKKKSQKKYGKKTQNNEVNNLKIEEIGAHHITRKNSIEINKDNERYDTNNLPKISTTHIVNTDQNEKAKEENFDYNKKMDDISSKKVESTTPKHSILLKEREYDEADNFIDENADHYDWEMKRLKKNMWLENLIPKSNKFLYNNKKYHDHMGDVDDIKKHEHLKKLQSVINHNRSKRSVLSSIFVQMPRDDDESGSNDEYASDNEESRNKKSKGSTTVCLEIKSDPTKPPSTICGPEIKPNTPLDPHTFDLASNQNYAPNNFYYTDLQPDQTVWSLNPLHDPSYYPSLNNYKYQSTNRENHQQPAHKHGVNNGEGLNKNKLKSSSQVAADKGYQEKKTPMTQNIVSPEDKTKSLDTMPLASNNAIQDNSRTTGRGQTPRNLLSENSGHSEDLSGVLRNNFKDLDWTLDGETSNNMNSYINLGQDVQSSPIWNTYGDAYENGFNSDQMTSYPLDLMTDEFKNTDISGQTEPKETLDSANENMLPAESTLRSAYEYYPDRGYPYRPNTYPYVPSRPYSYGGSHRPYIYDRYDPYCRSGRCRTAKMDGERSADTMTNGEQRLSSVDAMSLLQNQERNSEVFEDTADNFVGIPMSISPRDVQPSQFRGEVYYGRRYPYRPPYEYQGSSSSYPYSSRPYYGSSYPYERPYYGSSYERPYYGSSYPYDKDCRTADGRSCREAEEGRSSNDDPQFPPSAPVNQPDTTNSPQYDPYGNYRSMSLIQEAGPTPIADPSYPSQFKEIDSEILQQTAPVNPPQDAYLGSPTPLFRNMEPNFMHTVPTGLACNVIHTPMVSSLRLISTVGSLLHGMGIGAGHGNFGGGSFSGIGNQGAYSTYGGIGNQGAYGTYGGIGSPGGIGHGIHGLGTRGLTSGAVPTTGLVSSGHNVLSGVGSHGIGGSHGVVGHHVLLGEKTPIAKDIENNEESMLKSKNSESEGNILDVTPKPDTKTKPSAEELKNIIAEKLRAAEEKLRSSKNSILEKINKTVEKGKKVQETEKTDEDEGNPEMVPDPDSKGTFSYKAIVQFPTGGRISLNTAQSKASENARTMEFLTGSGGTPVINFRTPLGGSLTYDSPLFKTGLFGRGTFPSLFRNGYRSPNGEVPQCVCQPDTSSCVCPVTNVGPYPLTKNAHAYIDLSPNFQRAVVNPQYIESSYNPENGPILGIVPMQKSVAYTPVSESFETVQKSPITPCMTNQLLGSSVNQNVPIPQQPIVSPCDQSRSALGLIQYQPQQTRFYQDVQTQQQSIPSPMVGFASLFEMKERENQLKETHPGYMGYEGLNQLTQKGNDNAHNTYEDLYNESIGKQSTGTFKSSAASTLKKPSELEKLPSKILTAKPLKPPTPILKLPVPKPLKTTPKQPC